MVKRKMPKHIVLPNGMWRFIKSETKKKARKAAKAVKHRSRTSRRVRVMPKRYRVKHRRGIGLSGTSSLLKAAMVGLGTAAVVGKIAGQIIPYQDEIVAGVGAKVIGKSNLTGAIVAAAVPLALKYVPTIAMSAGASSGVPLN